MNQIKKHSFEAVSLLTAANGMLEVTIIPAINQPDWIVPSALVLDSINDNDEQRDTDNSQSSDPIAFYSWQQQQIAVFHLLPADQIADQIIILEGNNAELRLALKTQGQPRQLSIGISDVQDCELPEEYGVITNNKTLVDDNNIESNDQIRDDIAAREDTKEEDIADNNMASEQLVSEDQLSSYAFQAISIKDTIYVVPDLDKIAHHLASIEQPSS